MSKQTPSGETSTTVSSTLGTDSTLTVEVKDPLWAILAQSLKGKTQKKRIPQERGYQRGSR